MSELKLTFEFRITRRTAQWGLCALLVALCAPELASESVTLTTYYPAPSGIYTQMITTGNTWLARDGGTVSGKYTLTPNYQNWGSTGDGGAAITNDNGTYKKLMVVGNNSAGGTACSGIACREVGIWDNLTVNNNLSVTNSLTVTQDATISNNLTVSQKATVGMNLDVTGNGSSANGVGVFRQPGNSNCGASPAAYSGTNCTVMGNPAWCCPAGTYATMISGVMTKWTNIADPSNTDGTMLCCSCPNGSCPSL